MTRASLPACLATLLALASPLSAGVFSLPTGGWGKQAAPPKPVAGPLGDARSSAGETTGN